MLTLQIVMVNVLIEWQMSWRRAPREARRQGF